MQIATAYDEKKSGIPFIVKGRIPRFRRNTKGEKFSDVHLAAEPRCNGLSISGWVVL